jgi:hypothetical protein
MNKFLELITAPIEAGGQVRFELSGDYFEIIESDYPLTVLLEDRNGAQIGRMSNAETSYFLRDTEYKAITLSSTQAQTVRIAFGSGEAGTRRTAGVVQVIDGTKNLVMNGQTLAACPAVTAVAGQYPVVQLWNPSGSGRRIVVRAMDVSSIEAATIAAYPATVALTNNTTALRSGNLLLGGAVGVAQARTDASGPTYSFAAGCLMFATVAAGGMYRMPTDAKFVINPGSGLNVTKMFVTDGTIFANFIYNEEKI